MRRLIASSVIIIGSIIGNHSTVHTTAKEITKIETPIVEILIPRETVLKWEKVAICETGANWTLQGPIYSGALGIRNENWIAYGGLQFASNAELATPEEQIFIAQKIEGSSYVPDQNGCGQGW